MRIPGGHLSYCGNVHPGEGWEEHFGELRRALPEVKRRVSPDAPFGVGPRLSARAAGELSAPEALARFQAFLADHHLYVFTLNGFPYGAFHATRVKEAVYRPDWRDRRRLDYTLTLAGLLAELLPEGEAGSISTVPVGFRPDFIDAAGLDQATRRLAEAVAGLHRLERERGRLIRLALEPEPGCLLETTAEAVALFQERLWRGPALDALAPLTGGDRSAAEGLMRRHLGLCLDTCHAAVMYEEPEASLALLEESGLEVVKLQLSTGLRAAPVDDTTIERLRPFVDPVYLHQVVERGNGRDRFYLDLPEALAATTGRSPKEWRIHFHVPLFHQGGETLGTTRPFLERLLQRHRQRPISPHLEVETYTWGVLPEALRGMPLEEAIAQELTWVRETLSQ